MHAPIFSWVLKCMLPGRPRCSFMWAAYFQILLECSWKLLNAFLWLPFSLKSSLWLQRCFVPRMRNWWWESLILLGEGLKQVFPFTDKNSTFWTSALFRFPWDKSPRSSLHLLTASSGSVSFPDGVAGRRGEGRRQDAPFPWKEVELSYDCLCFLSQKAKMDWSYF